MKTCEGCRFLFEDGIKNDKGTTDIYLMCRGAPPSVVWFANAGDKGGTLKSWYPQAPGIRCGQFKRDWLWFLR